MARRTKEEALATRHGILDAAELLFQRQGVSRTTLQDIAQAAGLTRGAIYWHFKDKADLFNAMMERATMPLEETMALSPSPGEDDDPLSFIRDRIMHALRAEKLSAGQDDTAASRHRGCGCAGPLVSPP